MQKNCKHGITQKHHQLFGNQQILIFYREKSTKLVNFNK